MWYSAAFVSVERCSPATAAAALRSSSAPSWTRRKAVFLLAWLPEVLAFRFHITAHGEDDDVVSGLLDGCACAGGSPTAAMAIASPHRCCRQEMARHEPVACCACAWHLLQRLRQELAPDLRARPRVVVARRQRERRRSVGDLASKRCWGDGRRCSGARGLLSPRREAAGLAEPAAHATTFEEPGHGGRRAASSFIALPAGAPRRVRPPADTEVCAICLHIIERPLRVRCGHRFCRKCIRAWLSQAEACPVCRQPALSRLRAAGRRVQHAVLRAVRHFDRNAGFEGKLLAVLGVGFICTGFCAMLVLRALNSGGSAEAELLAWCFIASGGLLLLEVGILCFYA